MSTLREAYDAYPSVLAALKRFRNVDETQDEFDRILLDLSDLRERKVRQRGEARYHETDARRSKLFLGADIHRKYQRVDKFLIPEPGSIISTEDLEDDFMDLANYAAMGIQLGRREGWFK